VRCLRRDKGGGNGGEGRGEHLSELAVDAHGLCVGFHEGGEGEGEGGEAGKSVLVGYACGRVCRLLLPSISAHPCKTFTILSQALPNSLPPPPLHLSLPHEQQTNCANFASHAFSTKFRY